MVSHRKNRSILSLVMPWNDLQVCRHCWINISIIHLKPWLHPSRRTLALQRKAHLSLLCRSMNFSVHKLKTNALPIQKRSSISDPACWFLRWPCLPRLIRTVLAWCHHRYQPKTALLITLQHRPCVLHRRRAPTLRQTQTYVWTRIYDLCLCPCQAYAVRVLNHWVPRLCAVLMECFRVPIIVHASTARIATAHCWARRFMCSKMRPSVRDTITNAAIRCVLRAIKVLRVYTGAQATRRTIIWIVSLADTRMLKASVECG